MKYLLSLSKQNLKLSLFEALELLDVKKYELNENFLVVDINDKNKARKDTFEKSKSTKDTPKKEILNIFKRLAYTNYVDEVLFESSLKDLVGKIKLFNWQEHYSTNFCVRTINIEHENEKKYAGIIWNKLKAPKVNLTTPKTLFVFVKADAKIYATKLLWKNPKTFLKRKAHLRPALHPSSLDPRLAKACVNIAVGMKDIATAVKNKDKIKGAEVKDNRSKTTAKITMKTSAEITVLDPFCGSGGILIEAGLMGFNIVGCDIDKEMLIRAKTNLRHYKIKKFSLELHDALKLNRQVDAIVTDIPYGLNTKPVDIDKLLKQFLKKAYLYTKQMIIAFPSTIKYRKLLGKWKLKKEFEYYIHKSLTKRIILVGR
ncbi:methyltransferase domain-containing protein [Candidatus Woesearchaeota archaeon]|nr:methyltransferase domain-containing protein [Candidatus Woesearchaeota archaeon]